MDARRGSLSERLRHVYWLGGGSGAGKSSVARRLAVQFGLRCYSTDDAMRDHDSRYKPADCPFLEAFKKMDMDERWVNRPPQVMLETFHWFRGEGFDLIIEDLLEMPREGGVIAEGFRLLPLLVAPLMERPGRGVWLIPTPQFRLAAFESRGTLWSIAGKTSDPPRALDNLLARDHMFTGRIEKEAKEAGLAVVNVDASVTEDEVTSRVASRFGLG